MIQPGYRSGMLEVIKIVRSHHKGNTWLCKCDCSNTVELQESHITDRPNRRANKSCGCHRHKQNRLTVGGTSRLYKIWHSMIRRCTDPSHNRYKYYGENGVSVCDEWLNNYETFCKWALSNGYSDELSIDRIDQNGNYCPDNCRWSDVYTQAQNKGLRRNSTTGFTDIWKHKSGYRVAFRRNGSMHYVGIFKSLESAIRARDDAMKKADRNTQS